MKKIYFFSMIALLSATLTLSGCGKETAPTENTTGGETTKMEATLTTEETPVVEETKTVEEAPVKMAFSAVDMGIYTARDVYKTFTFEEGTGTCMDQGFPTNLVYTSDNLITTADSSYSDEWVSSTASGDIFFKVPLTAGTASCQTQFSKGVDTVTVACSIDEAEVCKADFKIFATK